MNNAPIGILDSGSGGLSIMTAVQSLLPHESILSIGDHKFLPYGDKKPEIIRARVIAMINFLVEKGAKLIVIACNTASVVGIDEYRTQFPQIPMVGVVPVVKTAAAVSKKRHAVVLSTKLTSESAYQKSLIVKFAGDCAITSIGSSKLVLLIESGHIDDNEIEDELKRIFRVVGVKPFDVIALGCTHYPFIARAISRIVGKDKIILDSSGAVARQIVRILTNRDELGLGHPTVTYYTTGDIETVRFVYKKLLGREVQVNHVEI